MRIFESLNCSLCKSPFISTANQPKSPRHLGCGKAVCHECFEAEKLLNTEERKHQCDEKDCFSNPNFLYSLIDLLSSGSLTHDPNRSGYLLSENFISPECPVCHEEFTTEGEKKPFFLKCLHDLCKECFEQCRKPNEGGEKDAFRSCVTCPKCSTTTLTNYPYSDDGPLLSSFEALKPIGRLVVEVNYVHDPFCDGCVREENMESFLYCPKCKRKLCCICAVKEVQLDEKSNQHPSRFFCSKCNPTSPSGDDRLDKQLLAFLDELPGMTRQLQEMENSQFRFCKACKCLKSIECMFECVQCNERICGTCAFQKHRLAAEHNVVSLLLREAMQLSDAIQQTTKNEVEAYQYLFPDLHQKLDDNIKDFLEKLIFTEEKLKKRPTFESLKTNYNRCRKLKNDFESTAEEYLPNLRKCNARLEDLIKDLEKNSV